MSTHNRVISVFAAFASATAPADSLAQQRRAPQPPRSCALVAESTVAVAQGPLFDARITVNERGGSLTMLWSIRDETEGLERWGGYATWAGAIPSTPLTLQQNIVGGACAPNVELRSTLFDGSPSWLTYAVHPPNERSADPLIVYGVGFDRPAIARTSAQQLFVERFAEAHTDTAAYAVAMGPRARNNGGTCELDEQWAGHAVAENAPRELRLLTFVPRQAPVSRVLYAQRHDPRDPNPLWPADVASRPIAVAVGPDGGVVIWPSQSRLLALSFASNLTADGGPREIASAPQGSAIGAPVIVARGRGFDAAWSVLNTSTRKYELVGASFTDRRATPSVTTLAQPAGANAFAPALSVQGTRLVLAWTEGDLQAQAVVRAGSSTQSLAAAAQSAALIGAPRGNRRDPELSSTAAGTWMVVQQFDARTRNGVARIATLRCDGP